MLQQSMNMMIGAMCSQYQMRTIKQLQTLTILLTLSLIHISPTDKFTEDEMINFTVTYIRMQEVTIWNLKKKLRLRCLQRIAVSYTHLDVYKRQVAELMYKADNMSVSEGITSEKVGDVSRSYESCEVRKKQLTRCRCV